MIPRGVLICVCALWVALAVAYPDPFEGIAERSTDSTLNPRDRDVLWEKYGLNKSAEFKYFHEPGRDDILGHYDTRFFTEPVPDEERSQTLTHMIRAYLNFFDDNGLETWIAHGTLLGWWWNGKVMPWDWDIDTQVTDTTLLRLADRYNQTIVRYKPRRRDPELSYLLDINPWARQRERGQGLNIIDARWIDMRTGLYIDITGLSHLDSNKPDMWQCKNNHKYQTDDIYPLRRTTFEGVSAKVPFQYKAVLIDEYNDKALTSTHFHNHTWRPNLEEWVLDKPSTSGDKDSKDDRQYEKRAISFFSMIFG
ncbi:hypothetical protein P170DRAFT_369031 [Aspergillus steynii IBT 23096]|uniref:LicD/FKTN/FKRP nucleotidyltransferase domain-containing protein n=1 Tax=Aspergillus steynii IBT 23096 TaxID=1392250 RepID=A0A2I2FSK1_9EURO|nr:uncharacterized protein P170DRAFT_369031 [Aspergillus steynii IBT 23096]PLB43597.1 hypothetical protein P170DRAFT_369031 [Aspergillus steynii IBT 23096]